MCSGNDCLIYYLVLVLIFFFLLIYFLLKYRAFLQKRYLETKHDQVWEKVKKRGDGLNFLKEDMIFGIWQDASMAKMSLVVKDSKNQIVGEVFKEMRGRKQIKIGDQIFLIEFPLTWNRTAILYSADGARIIARYRKLSWFTQHEFDVEGYGILKSDWPGFNLNGIFNYKLQDRLVGTCQNLSSTREKGRLLVFSADLPLEIQLFILSM